MYLETGEVSSELYCGRTRKELGFPQLVSDLILRTAHKYLIFVEAFKLFLCQVCESLHIWKSVTSPKLCNNGYWALGPREITSAGRRRARSAEWNAGRFAPWDAEECNPKLDSLRSKERSKRFAAIKRVFAEFSNFDAVRIGANAKKWAGPGFGLVWRSDRLTFDSTSVAVFLGTFSFVFVLVVVVVFVVSIKYSVPSLRRASGALRHPESLGRVSAFARAVLRSETDFWQNGGFSFWAEDREDTLYKFKWKA